MRNGAALVCLCAVLLFTQPLRGGVTIAPAAPTSRDVVTAAIDVPVGCTVTTRTTTAGTVIRTDVAISGCIVGPPPFSLREEVVLGVLPAGTYTYEVYVIDDGARPSLATRVPLVVAPVAVPMLRDGSLAVLAVTLACAASLVVRR